MISDSEFRNLDNALKQAKANATAFADQYNAPLPAERCPSCKTKDHCPGLACPECGYIHPVSWAIIRDTDWGYNVVSLNNQRNLLAEFCVKNIG